MAKSIHFNPEDKKAAMNWWNSLLGGKKRYLKEHSKLTTEDKIVRFWLAQVKQVKQVVYSGNPSQLPPIFGRGAAASAAIRELAESGVKPDFKAFNQRAIRNIIKDKL